MAAACHAKQLCIGHFSARYEDENVLLREAQKEFSNTILAKENLTIQV
jgi:ribonuclease Z